MSDPYNPLEIEPRWRQRWEASGQNQRPKSATNKSYCLTMYPYPSGNLHIGHWYAYAPSDARARYMRMRGHDVFFPMGFDAFGLPAENAAIRHGAEPAAWTHQNIDYMRTQLATMGTMFDWSAQVVTCDPDYYRWNQWFFLKMWEKGLAYRKFAAVDFCPNCNTTLAREQVVGEERLCERCDTPVVRRELEQWFLAITRYADELLDGLDQLEWPERVKVMQRNWIGRSQGAEIAFAVPESEADVRVFTTRPDTVFGATAVVLAPEHPLVEALTAPGQSKAVADYIAQATRRTEIDRQSLDREKTGIPLGGSVAHPFTGAALPVWIADYVLPGYGTGALMLVPAHDERDHDFARRYSLPIVQVIEAPPDSPDQDLPYLGPGRLISSGQFDGLTTAGKAPGEVTDAKLAIASALVESDRGGPAVTYRLRDWLVSRQRYWGTPIPAIHCETCGVVPVPYAELPVTLPHGVAFLPTGESPLKFATEWRRVACPSCGGSANRDTDTMDTFVDSSWYQYRYLSPGYADGPFDPAEAAWLPVDQYTGGIEHATMHLLYTRFWTRVMRDMGLVDFDEPMLRLFNQGIILGEDSEKMSKSRGNVVDPDELVRRHGADAVRAYIMFIGPWDQGGPWDPRGIQGVVRWLADMWHLAQAPAGPSGSGNGSAGSAAAEDELRRAVHHTTMRVTADMDAFAFNTAIAALMELRNSLKRLRNLAGSPVWDEAISTSLRLMAPLVPHITEELWARRGATESIHLVAWPEYDPALAAPLEMEVAVQVRGKIRDRIRLPADSGERTVVDAAMALPVIADELAGRAPSRVIYVPGRLVNLVP